MADFKKPIDQAIARRNVALGEVIMETLALLKSAENSILSAVLYCSNDEIMQVQDTLTCIDGMKNALETRFYATIQAAKNQREKVC